MNLTIRMYGLCVCVGRNSSRAIVRAKIASAIVTLIYINVKPVSPSKG
ncbi:MAG: hypothetical protein MUE44_24550 [Oscillatoriaceae cyanobacterium Prado104]|nr:hypothetical protein [Oscillatoriaceae cyanobacterium Prado104]